jgi:hypothetical protein
MRAGHAPGAGRARSPGSTSTDHRADSTRTGHSRSHRSDAAAERVARLRIARRISRPEPALSLGRASLVGGPQLGRWVAPQSQQPLDDVCPIPGQSRGPPCRPRCIRRVVVALVVRPHPPRHSTDRPAESRRGRTQSRANVAYPAAQMSRISARLHRTKRCRSGIRPLSAGSAQRASLRTTSRSGYRNPVLAITPGGHPGSREAWSWNAAGLPADP